MLLNIWKKIEKSPTIILIPVFILLLLGLFSLLSITTLQSQAPPNAFSKQLFFLIPSFIMLFVMSVLSKRLIHKYIYVFYVAQKALGSKIDFSAYFACKSTI